MSTRWREISGGAVGRSNSVVWDRGKVARYRRRSSFLGGCCCVARSRRCHCTVSSVQPRQVCQLFSAPHARPGAAPEAKGLLPREARGNSRAAKQIASG